MYEYFFFHHFYFSRSKLMRAGARKRSYSFTEGHIKHPASVKRWKLGRGGGGRGRGAGGPPASNVLPSKFLLGGNIHDPLNLNSLSDEKVARLGKNNNKRAKFYIFYIFYIIMVIVIPAL